MPPAALLVGGLVAGGIGAGLSQSAANKGPQPVFPGLNSLALTTLAGFGSSAPKTLSGVQDTLGGIAKNPGALPDVSGTVNPAFQALYNANKQFVQQGRANLAEKFGSTGLSSSSPFAVASSNYETQSNADFMSILANYTLQAQQFASNRQLSALGTSAGIATNELQDFLNAALTLKGPKGSVAGAVFGSASGGLETIALLRALGSLPGSSGGGG